MASVCAPIFAPHFDDRHSGPQLLAKNIDLALGVLAIPLQYGAQKHILQVVQHHAMTALPQPQCAVGENWRS